MKLTFLNVSVWDRDKDAWKRMLASEKTPKGTHIINDGSIFDATLSMVFLDIY